MTAWTQSLHPIFLLVSGADIDIKLYLFPHGFLSWTATGNAKGMVPQLKDWPNALASSTEEYTAFSSRNLLTTRLLFLLEEKALSQHLSGQQASDGQK